MKVLGLCSYPIESAATRYRLLQFVEPLAERGIDLTVRPFLSSAAFQTFYQSGRLLQKSSDVLLSGLNRFSDVFRSRKYDLVIVQREAMFLGPPLFEYLTAKVGNCPLILDLDDATYVRYVSPTYGKIGSALKFFGKTDYLIKKSNLVVCGNRYIADYVNNKKTKSVVIPTVVDTDKFHPVEKENDSAPIVGWIGTHSTFPFLQMIFPVLAELGKKYNFKLKIIGAGDVEKKQFGLDAEFLEWNLKREVKDFQSFDIGLYPMTVTQSASPDWLAGKSGFKAIQYMSIGIPFVMTPIGVCGEIGEPGKTHFAAQTLDEWTDKLSILLSDRARRREMGAAGRKYALQNFTVAIQADKLSNAVREAAGKSIVSN